MISNKNKEMKNQSHPNSKTCKQFNETTFFGNISKPSIYLILPRGRLGNMMLGYSIILELQNRLQIKPLVNRECLSFLKTTFEEDTLTIPAIEDTYCNYKNLVFETFDGTFRELISNSSYHSNRMLWLYPYIEIMEWKDGGNRNVGGYR